MECMMTTALLIVAIALAFLWLGIALSTIH
ncbi:hypothetical protein SEA_BOILGATE_77 [Mycobacterium phage Boilgate]|nr:hypothetical protein SEA_BOILGATE_77 [Mycobacterium phage Boilgate]